MSIITNGVTRSTDEKGILPEKACRSCLIVLAEVLHQRVKWKVNKVQYEFLRARESVWSCRSGYHFDFRWRLCRESMDVFSGVEEIAFTTMSAEVMFVMLYCAALVGLVVRSTVHGTRYTVHGTRYTVHGTRYTVHGHTDTRTRGTGDTKIQVRSESSRLHSSIVYCRPREGVMEGIIDNRSRQECCEVVI